MPFIVAIDGPAGAGKSTVARRVAKRLKMERVDTGAIYRSVTLASHREGLRDEAQIVERLPQLELHFEDERIWLGGEDISAAIRSPEITEDVSRVSAMAGVRAGLLDMQRRLGLACPHGAILEGRDIGTVVFPDADVKIFLTASPAERATRRMKDFAEAGLEADYDAVLAAIIERDRLDSERPIAPLRQAPDAARVETDAKSEDDVVEELVALIENRRLSPAE